MYILNIYYNLPKVEIQHSLLISHKSSSPCVLNSGLYGTYCTVLSVHCGVCTVFSLFVWQTWLAKPKQKLSVNDIFNTKFCRIKCNVYCIQCNVGTVFLFDYQDCKILNQR